MSGISSNSGITPLTNYTKGSKIESKELKETFSKINSSKSGSENVCTPLTSEKNEIKQFKSKELKEFKIDLEGKSKLEKTKEHTHSNEKIESLNNSKEHKINDKELKNIKESLKNLKKDQPDIQSNEKFDSVKQSIKESISNQKNSEQSQSHIEPNNKKVDMMNTDPAFIQFAEKIKHK